MLVSGEIVILVNDKPETAKKVQYGFVKSKDLKEDIFFNTLSNFGNTSFESLKVGDKVSVFVKKTERGPYAETLSLLLKLHKTNSSPSPEATP